MFGWCAGESEFSSGEWDACDYIIIIIILLLFIIIINININIMNCYYCY